MILIGLFRLCFIGVRMHYQKYDQGYLKMLIGIKIVRGYVIVAYHFLF